MMANRGRPPGQPKTGGRVKKSLDRQQRVLVAAELAHSIMATFEMLGGTAAMTEWASANQTVFYTQILSRLMPPPQRDGEADVQINQQINVSNLSEKEAAIRVAFALSKAIYDEPAPAIERVPETYPAPRWSSPDAAPEMPPLLPPESIADIDRQRSVQDLSLTDDQRRANRLVEPTKAPTYNGSAAEQGLSRISRRRSELL